MFSSFTTKAPKTKIDETKQKAFSDHDYLITPTSPSKKYSEEFKTKNVHIGQLKLFLSHLNLLLRYRSGGPQTLLYIGAAPGHNIFLLSEMFPDITFHLYDNNDDHKANGNYFSKDLILKSKNKKSNVKLFETYFEDKHYSLYEGMDDLILCSDIRRLDYDASSSYSEEDDALVEADLKLQEKWVRRLKPKVSYLKFRLMFVKQSEFPYLDGYVFLQPFGRKKSTECRLLVLDPGSHKMWNDVLHESQLFYHNVVVRPSKFLNPVTMKAESYGNNYDNTYLKTMAKDFLEATGSKVNVKNVKLLTTAWRDYLEDRKRIEARPETSPEKAAKKVVKKKTKKSDK